MIDLFSRADLFELFVESFPGKIVIQDSAGHCCYSNDNQISNSSECNDSESGPSSSPNVANYHEWSPIGTSDGVRGTEQENEAKTTVHFPLKNKLGAVIGKCHVTVKTGNTENRGSDSHQAPSEDCLTSHEETAVVKNGTLFQPARICSSSYQECQCCYRDIFQSIQTAVARCHVILDPNGEPENFYYEEVNTSFKEVLWGMAEQGKDQEWHGKKVTEIFPGIEKDPAQWIRNFCQVALTGKTYNFMKYSDFLRRWYRGIVYRPNHDDNRRFAVLFLDHSELIHSQQALRESEERHRSLFETMIQGVVYQEASGNIIAANPSSERILGLSVEQMMGRTSIDPRWRAIREDGSAFPGQEHPSMEAIRTGKPVTNVIMGVFSPQDNEYRWIKIDAMPRFEPGVSTPYQVYTVFTDMTDTIRFEKQLVAAKKKAENADRLKSSFLANMSHEIRTPLNGIIGHIDLALANGLAEHSREENLEGLQIARSSGELLINIIQDILDLSKIEAGQLLINNDETFSLRAVVQQTESIAKAMIQTKHKHVKFEVEVDPALRDMLLGDSFRIQQVINNLVSNAIKFTDEGKVKFSVKLVGTKSRHLIEYSVLDTGKGIPPSHIETVFEPFRQVDVSDTRKHGGTGLGLTISSKLVELMQGNLRVESSTVGPLRGSYFVFALPYRTSQSGSSTTRDNNSGLQVETFNTRSAKIDSSMGIIVHGKILVAEDDHVSRRMIHRMLEICTGCRSEDVLLARDGKEAVDLYQRHRDTIVLILMDVQMPRLDGLAATALIRDMEKGNAQGGSGKSVPILALSAGAMKGDSERGMAVGMTDYLTKPVNLKRLAETLRYYLGENANELAEQKDKSQNLVQQPTTAKGSTSGIENQEQLKKTDPKGMSDISEPWFCSINFCP